MPEQACVHLAPASPFLGVTVFCVLGRGGGGVAVDVADALSSYTASGAWLCASFSQLPLLPRLPLLVYPCAKMASPPTPTPCAWHPDSPHGASNGQ